MSIDVCIGNYGYYNEGELRDAWISLPKTSEEISDFLSAHGLQDPEHEEIYISDYDGVPFGLTGLFSEFTWLEDLNMLARQMEEREGAVEKVQGALDCGIDGPESVIGLMNWIEQADEIPYYAYGYTGAYARDEWGQTCIERLSAEENYGYTVLEDTDLMRMLEKDSDAMSAFDVKRYGRLCSDSGDVQLGDKGYVDAVQEIEESGVDAVRGGAQGREGLGCIAGRDGVHLLELPRAVGERVIPEFKGIGDSAIHRIGRFQLGGGDGLPAVGLRRHCGPLALSFLGVEPLRGGGRL